MGKYFYKYKNWQISCQKLFELKKIYKKRNSKKMVEKDNNLGKGNIFKKNGQIFPKI